MADFAVQAAVLRVAAFTGGVDRNGEGDEGENLEEESPPSRAAWIEIDCSG